MPIDKILSDYTTYNCLLRRSIYKQVRAEVQQNVMLWYTEKDRGREPRSISHVLLNKSLPLLHDARQVFPACAMRLIPASEELMGDVSVLLDESSNRLVARKSEEGHLEYQVPGGSQISVSWK